MPTLPVPGRHDLRDREWLVLEPLLPAGKKAGRPPRWGRRQLLDGIRWRVRAGCPWRDVPARYGPWQSVYGLFRRWQRSGTWQAIMTALQGRCEAAGLITWDVSAGFGDRAGPPARRRRPQRQQRAEGAAGRRRRPRAG